MSDESRRRIDWGHLALLAVITTVVVAYLFDARAVSLKTNNLLLVQPAAFVALALVLIIVPQLFVRRAAAADEEAAARLQERMRLVRVGGLAALFGVFVFSMEAVGFDVATFVFVAVGLLICGEKRLWVVVPFSAVFTVAVIYGYQLLVPYPFPLLVL